MRIDLQYSRGKISAYISTWVIFCALLASWQAVGSEFDGQPIDPAELAAIRRGREITLFNGGPGHVFYGQESPFVRGEQQRTLYLSDMAYRVSDKLGVPVRSYHNFTTKDYYPSSVFRVGMRPGGILNEDSLFIFNMEGMKPDSQHWGITDMEITDGLTDPNVRPRMRFFEGVDDVTYTADEIYGDRYPLLRTHPDIQKKLQYIQDTIMSDLDPPAEIAPEVRLSNANTNSVVEAVGDADCTAPPVGRGVYLRSSVGKFLKYVGKPLIAVSVTVDGSKVYYAETPEAREDALTNMQSNLTPAAPLLLLGYPDATARRAAKQGWEGAWGGGPDVAIQRAPDRTWLGYFLGYPAYSPLPSLAEEEE